jgi:hypothetical protein
VALGQVFSENFGFPCHPTFHLLLHNHLHYHPRLAQLARSCRSANSLTNQIIIIIIILRHALHASSSCLPAFRVPYTHWVGGDIQLMRVESTDTLHVTPRVIFLPLNLQRLITSLHEDMTIFTDDETQKHVK